jgi:hypothetical protein
MPLAREFGLAKLRKNDRRVSQASKMEILRRWKSVSGSE